MPTTEREKPTVLRDRFDPSAAGQATGRDKARWGRAGRDETRRDETRQDRSGAEWSGAERNESFHGNHRIGQERQTRATVVVHCPAPVCARHGVVSSVRARESAADADEDDGIRLVHAKLLSWISNSPCRQSGMLQSRPWSILLDACRTIHPQPRYGTVRYGMV